MQIRFRNIIAGLVLGLAALTGFTGCANMKANSDPRQTEDNRITAQVRGKLKSNPIYKFRNVQVAASYGKVQLSGFTTDPKEKQAAEDLARKVDGVKDVMNEIMVQQ